MEIFCNSPEKFNDPFDCQIEINHKQVLGGVKNYKEIKNQKFLNIIMNSLEKDLKRFNVSSFSKSEEKKKKSYENELLWAHYGDCHKGVCIEYDLDNLKKINYSYDYPKFSENFYKTIFLMREEGLNSYNKYNEKLINEVIRVHLLTKSKAWDYEEEWRLIQLEPIKKIEKSQIKSIYFGLKTDENNIKTIIKILSNLEIDIPIYKMEKVKEKFLFEPILLNKDLYK